MSKHRADMLPVETPTYYTPRHRKTLAEQVVTIHDQLMLNRFRFELALLPETEEP